MKDGAWGGWLGQVWKEHPGTRGVGWERGQGPRERGVGASLWTLEKEMTFLPRQMLS